MVEETREHVREVFPEVDWIEDDDLRAGTLRAWETTIEETGIDDLEAYPWRVPEQRRLGIPLDAEVLVDHVRNVTRGGAALADLFAERRGLDIDRDVVVAGGLLHDVSKLYEFDEDGETAIGDLLGHPYIGIHVAERAGLPIEITHIVLSHTHTPVEPATLEAAIVQAADMADAAAIYAPAVPDLREV
jgi:putative nucleotidyltransferase with HDIG domain